MEWPSVYVHQAVSYKPSDAVWPGRRGDTHDACCTSRDLQVRRDKVHGEFETGEEGGRKEGDVAATLDGQGAEDGEGDEEGAAEEVRDWTGECVDRSRSSTWVACESLAALCPGVLLELEAELVDLSWPVSCIVGETGELLRIRPVLWACGGERGRRGVAGGDEGHVMGREVVHQKEPQRRRFATCHHRGNFLSYSLSSPSTPTSIPAASTTTSLSIPATSECDPSIIRIHRLLIIQLATPCGGTSIPSFAGPGTRSLRPTPRRGRCVLSALSSSSNASKSRCRRRLRHGKPRIRKNVVRVPVAVSSSTSDSSDDIHSICSAPSNTTCSNAAILLRASERFPSFLQIDTVSDTIHA